MAKLYYYYSAMNAGKSTMLLQSNYNYRERGMETLLLLPAQDTRQGIGNIHSRLGVQAKAKVLEKDADILAYVRDHKKRFSNLKCLLIDEAQFLNKQQVIDLTHVVDDLNIPVLCYGLRTDFQGRLFEGSKWLLAWADEIIEVKTMCHCGKKATMNMRISAGGKKVAEGPQIQIGGNELYISVCRRHHKAGDAGK